MKILELQKNKFGTMTHEEKHMNKGNLHNYKTNTHRHTEAMIPGIYNLNSVGSSPLRRGAR